MSKFVYVFTGGTMAATPEEQQSVMQQWGTWFGTLGSAVLEEGNPFGASATVTATGVTPGGPAGGYTIIDAASLEDATDKAKGCPVLPVGGTVEVYEALSM
jgi:hypothetical protein